MPNIKYHPDVHGYAVNVKTHGMHFAEGGTELQREYAWDSTHEDWWNAANEVAKQEGFSGVGSCGRSGGWCAPYDTNKAVPESRSDHYAYVEDENDPRLAKFAERIEALLSIVPAMYKQTLDGVIKEDEDRERESERRDGELHEMRAVTLGMLDVGVQGLTPYINREEAKMVVAYWRKQWGMS